jgi:hypothetical protein
VPREIKTNQPGAGAMLARLFTANLHFAKSPVINALGCAIWRALFTMPNKLLIGHSRLVAISHDRHKNLCLMCIRQPATMRIEFYSAIF